MVTDRATRSDPPAGGGLFGRENKTPKGSSVQWVRAVRRIGAGVAGVSVERKNKLLFFFLCLPFGSERSISVRPEWGKEDEASSEELEQT